MIFKGTRVVRIHRWSAFELFSSWPSGYIDSEQHSRIGFIWTTSYRISCVELDRSHIGWTFLVNITIPFMSHRPLSRVFAHQGKLPNWHIQHHRRSIWNVCLQKLQTWNFPRPARPSNLQPMWDRYFLGGGRLVLPSLPSR